MLHLLYRLRARQAPFAHTHTLDYRHRRLNTRTRPSVVGQATHDQLKLAARWPRVVVTSKRRQQLATTLIFLLFCFCSPSFTVLTRSSAALHALVLRACSRANNLDAMHMNSVNLALHCAELRCLVRGYVYREMFERRVFTSA